MNISDIIRRRKIAEIFHFTTNEGLLGVLYTRALKSRKRLPKEKQLEYIFKPNANLRKDKEWLDYVNLSISRINYQFFNIASKSWHRERDIWWCVLSFDPEILTHTGVFFATTNNMYTGVSRNTGPEGLKKLFAERIEQWHGQVILRDPNLPDKYPTCSQAEVLYPEEISTDLLKRIYVISEEHADEICGQFAGVAHPVIDVTIAPALFQEG